MARLGELVRQSAFGYRTPVQMKVEPRGIKPGAIFDGKQFLSPFAVRSWRYFDHPRESFWGELADSVSIVGAIAAFFVTINHEIPGLTPGWEYGAAGLLAAAGTKFTYNIGANAIMNARHKI